MFRFLKVRFMFSQQIQINAKQFGFDEIKKMCSMLNLHYHLFNEQIDIYEDVKLLDENNKVIGVYKPDDAKKKVSQLRKDLVLFNAVSKPIICKALSYRQDIVNKFYKDLVLVKKESIMKASNLLKTIKLNPNATDKELQIKTNQIIELAKRNSQVKITIRSKRIQDEDKVLNKINALRNLLHGKVKIITDVTQQGKDEDEDDDEEEIVDEKFFSGADRKRTAWQIVIESLKGQFQTKLDKTIKQQPEDSIRKFLQGFFEQQDPDMKQLKFDINKLKYNARHQNVATTKISSEDPQAQQQQVQDYKAQQLRFKQQFLTQLKAIKKAQFQIYQDLKLRERLRQLGIVEKP